MLGKQIKMDGIRDGHEPQLSSLAQLSAAPTQLPCTLFSRLLCALTYSPGKVCFPPLLLNVTAHSPVAARVSFLGLLQQLPMSKAVLQASVSGLPLEKAEEGSEHCNLWIVCHGWMCRGGRRGDSAVRMKHLCRQCPELGQTKVYVHLYMGFLLLNMDPFRHLIKSKYWKVKPVFLQSSCCLWSLMAFLRHMIVVKFQVHIPKMLGSIQVLLDGNN